MAKVNFRSLMPHPVVRNLPPPPILTVGSPHRQLATLTPALRKVTFRGRLPAPSTGGTTVHFLKAPCAESPMSILRKQILIIEEEPTLLDITAFRLELLGYEVQSQSSADSALTWLAQTLPDLIAVGRLADMDPVEFLNRISDDPRTSQTPILYLSPNSDIDEVQRAYNAGADEYLLTPFDPLVLEKKVDGLLHAADLQKA